MILKAAARGNGRQFAYYLLHSQKNEQVRVLDISGTANPRDLHDSLIEMSAYERLTRSEKGILQVVVSPALGEDRQMTDDDWRLCRRTIAEKIGYQDQAYAMVIHECDGRTHAHIAFQRYDLETELMKGMDHVGLNLKQARLDLELELKHKHLLSWQERKAQAEQELKADLENKRQQGVEKQHNIEQPQREDSGNRRKLMGQMLDNGDEIESQKKPDDLVKPKSIYDLAREEYERALKMKH